MLLCPNTLLLDKLLRFKSMQAWFHEQSARTWYMEGNYSLKQATLWLPHRLPACSSTRKRSRHYQISRKSKLGKWPFKKYSILADGAINVTRRPMCLPNSKRGEITNRQYGCYDDDDDHGQWGFSRWARSRRHSQLKSLSLHPVVSTEPCLAHQQATTEGDSFRRRH